LPQDATLFQQGNLAVKIEGQKLVLMADSKISSDSDLKPTGWQYVTATIDNGKVALYVDGKNTANGNITLADAQQPVQLGTNYSGEMDQVELANVARTADWIKLAADGQGPDSQLLKIEEESAEGDEEGGTSYFGVLFNSLTTDAWVVIIILAIMFVISAAVMVTKAMLITRTAKGNDVFIDRFRNANADLLELEPQAITAESSIYRLYGAGLREIRKRYKDEKLSLSGAALNAIKASIDAELIRETHTLNAKMVLLTIAISGGPFLGLLGTVVGVMITFAAIAAAGDVNVNAIAPGIAAALLATVAGLAVAIPALFGYNYLGSRIKTITSDMQIFVDEFITRVAELHGQ
jgi:biopolymer transport protein ExbB